MVHNMVVLYWISKMKQLQILQHLYVALEKKSFVNIDVL